MAIRFKSSNYALAASAQSVTVTAPAGIVDGDILFASFYVNYAQTSKTLTPPSGWTQIGTTQELSGSFTARAGIYYKRASSESGDYTFTHDDTAGRTSAAISVFSGCIGSGSPIDQYSSANINSTTTITATGITPTESSDALIYTVLCDHASDPVASPPSGFTTIVDSNGAGLNFHAYAIQHGAIATGDVAGTTTSATNSAAYLVSLKQAPVDFFQFFEE